MRPLPGTILLPVGSARIRRQAVLMYVLFLPALTPFVLLGTVMGLAWLEDHVLPQAEPTATAPEEPRVPVPVPTATTGAIATTGASGRRPPRLAAPGPRRPRVPQGMSL